MASPFTSGSALPTIHDMNIASATQHGEGSYLDGQLLLAMPGMGDSRFEKSVIFICAHSPEGAMGIVVNQIASHISFVDLLTQLDVIDEERAILSAPADKMRVHRGGPVETGRGFVLHTTDYFVENSTLPISDSVYLTATLDVLKALATGRGPRQALLALGYAGWSPGQLESEIQANGWLNCPVDMGILFDPDFEVKYERAMRKIGIDPMSLSSEAGHA